MENKIVLILIFISIFISFGLGILVSENNISLYNILNSLTENSFKDYNSDANLSYLETEIQSLIHIKNIKDLQELRENLIKYIWKTDNLPNDKKPELEKNFDDDRFEDLMNLERIDRLTVNMDKGFNSISYIFIPTEPNGKLIIYHEGHSGDFINGVDTIQFFLNRGYSIMAFSMPLLGLNNQPVIELPQYGQIKLNSHNQFIFLESENFSTIKYFIEPIYVSLNYIESNYNFKSYYMIGVSGGGWTTVLYTALDERISQSYSIAGSLPIFLRINVNDIGDYEQILPELYNIANYLDLYIMSSYGDNRKFVQIFNKFDPCCFSGERAKIYSDEIQSTLSKLGKGEFEIHIDDTHKNHKISNHALEIILNDIK